MGNRDGKDGKGPAGSAVWAKETDKLGKTLLQANHLPSTLNRKDTYLKQLKFVCKDDEGDDWLGIISVDTDEGPMIAFHGASSFSETIRGIMARIENGSLKWRKDEYRS